MERTSYFAALARLLVAVFGGQRYTPGYLEWQYGQNPDGQEVATDLEKDGALTAHYAVIPQAYCVNGQSRLLSLSLNTAVSAAARGKGVFTGLAETTFAKAAAAGIGAVLGVANANSTPGFLGRLKFHHIASLPAVIGVALPAGNAAVQSQIADSAYLRSADFVASAESLAPAAEFGQDWSATRLGWRLASPLNRYVMHKHAEGILITTTERRHGVAFAVLLKALPRKGYSAISDAATKQLIRAAARHHRTPLFVYAGFSDYVAIKGIALPKRLRPSPLNLIYRPLTEAMPAVEQVWLNSFEFLDFDAY